MLLIWIGALLILGGVLFLTIQPLRRGQLSGSFLRAKKSIDTLEPSRPATGFGIRSNWPGLALVALGAVLMLAAAVI